MAYTNRIQACIVALLAGVSISTVGCQRETDVVQNSSDTRTESATAQEPSDLTVDDEWNLDHEQEPFDEDLELEWVEIEEVPVPIINESQDARGGKKDGASTKSSFWVNSRQAQAIRLLNKGVLTPDGSARFRFPVDGHNVRVSLGPIKTKAAEIMYIVATNDNVSFMAMQKPDTEPLAANVQEARREMERRRDEVVTRFGDELIECEIVTDDDPRKIELTFSRKGNDRTPPKLFKTVTYFANGQTYSLFVITKLENPVPDKAREFFDSFRLTK